MPFVKRNADGEIVAASPAADGDCNEEIGHADLAQSGFVAGLLGDGEETRQLASTDLELVRVLEDLVELLVDKGVILFTELPASAQRKVLKRQQLRSRMGRSLDDLLGSD